MQFSTKTSAPEKTRTGCAIVAVHGGKAGAAARAIDAQAHGAIAAALGRGDLPAKAGSARRSRTASTSSGANSVIRSRRLTYDGLMFSALAISSRVW